MQVVIRALSTLVLCALSAPASDAQRVRPARLEPPLLGPVRPHSGSGPLALDGDTPLTELARFSGRVDVFVQVLPFSSDGPTGGIFTVSGIPAGATIRRAWLQVTSFSAFPDQPVSVSFAGNPMGPKPADVVDGGSVVAPTLYCSLYRFDVTGAVPGNGSYAYHASGHDNAYGDALVVVYEHASLPLRTIVVHDGAESLQGTTETTFVDMPCTPGELLLFTEADNSGEFNEQVDLNGVAVAGPGDLFHANVGSYASLVTIPVGVQSGANTMELFTGNDWLGVHLAILSAEGVRLGFETEDDFTTPLANGQSLSTPPEFGQLVAISSTGANAGPAIFDSSPGGPNDPSQDRDLLVGLGHVLILQNSQVPMQTVPGLFDRPNDDENGGALVFDFAAPVEPCCLALVDIDAGVAQASNVTLTDSAGRLRVYTVPPRWTEDLLADGLPGWRELDLQTLVPQAGFQSVATAGESPGFDPTRVVRLTVHLGSSGAVDGLVFASD